MSWKMSWLSIVLMAALIAACQPGPAVEAPAEDLTQPPVEPTGEGVSSGMPVPNATGEPTDETIVVEPPRTTGFELEGITFSPDNTFTDVSGQVVEGEPVAADSPYWVMPAHLRFDFLNYPVASTYHSAQLYVFPVANFAGYPEQWSAIGYTLSDILAGRPDLSTLGGMQNPLPLLPIFNAAQVIVAKPEYVDFQNGSGIRYLTQYDQAPIPINNNELFYTFQGLTNDGQYYVAAIFPVNHPDLPGGLDFTQEQYEAFGANPEQAIADVTAMLNAADHASFTLDLSRLDAFVQTIHAAPTQ